MAQQLPAVSPLSSFAKAELTDDVRANYLDE
jgi:hypothetical protein